MPSPAGGQVCSLQLLPSLASAVIIGPKFRATHDHIFLSQILVSPQSGGPEPRIPQERCGPLIPSQAQKNTMCMSRYVEFSVLNSFAFSNRFMLLLRCGTLAECIFGSFPIEQPVLLSRD